MSRFGDLLKGKTTPAPEVKADPAPKPVVEKKPDLKSMDKKELESYGRTKGVELDRRHSKDSLIKELEELD